MPVLGLVMGTCDGPEANDVVDVAFEVEEVTFKQRIHCIFVEGGVEVGPGWGWGVPMAVPVRCL